MGEVVCYVPVSIDHEKLSTIAAGEIMYNVIHFLLTPDKSASRRLRRIVAESAARIGVTVGTWPELVTALQKNYNQLELADTWDISLKASARALTDAFWAKSMEVAEKETLDSVPNCHFTKQLASNKTLQDACIW